MRRLPTLLLRVVAALALFGTSGRADEVTRKHAERGERGGKHIFSHAVGRVRQGKE
jgi:hypothetical protein